MDLKNIDFGKLEENIKEALKNVLSKVSEATETTTEEGAPDAFVDFLLDEQSNLTENLANIKDYYENNAKSMVEVESCLQQMHDITVKINFLDELIETWSNEFGDNEDEEDEDDDTDEENDEEDSDDDSVKTYVFKITL